MLSDAKDKRALCIKLYLLSYSSTKLKLILFFLFLICVGLRFSQRPDPSNCSFFECTVKAINAGHRFYHLDSNNTPIPYHNQLIDSGARVCFSSVAFVFSAIPYLKEYQFKASDIRYIAMVIFFLINLGLILIRLPNLLLITSQFAIWFSIFYIDHSLFWGDSNFKAMDGLAPVILSVFLIFLTTDNPGSKKIAGYVIFGLICGILPIFRQTTSFIFKISFLGIFLSLCLVYLIRYTGRSSFFFKILEKLFWSVVSFSVVRIAIAVFCSLVFLNKVSIEPTIVHGSGQPLYCGLGYVENPYNIAWEDDNADVNHMLIYDDAKTIQNLSWANDLGKMFQNFVIQDPFLLCRNIAKKFIKLNSYLFTCKLNNENDFDVIAVSPKKAHLIFYMTSIFCFASMGIYLAIKKVKKITILIFLSTSVIAIASFAGPLIVFPGYYASVLGLVYSILFVIFPFFVLVERGFFQPVVADNDDHNHIKNRILAISVALLAATGGYVVCRSIKNTHEAHRLLADSNPLERIEAAGYQYGYLFNRLNMKEQEKIIESIKRNATKGNVRWMNESGDVFSPKCTIFTHKKGKNFGEAHLIVRLSDKRIPPLPKADQGPSNSYILLSRENIEFVPGRFNYDPSTCVYNRITDDNWNGKYTFITLPIHGDFVHDTQNISVSAWNMIADRSANTFYHERIR